MSLKWTPLSPIGNKVQFFDPLNPSASYAIPQINPQTETIQTGDVRKYTQSTNGTSVIIGKHEYPPQEITLNWEQIDISDFINISRLSNTSPLVYVDSNGNGYLGVLQVYSAAQLAGMTSNVWTCQMNFLVLGPFSGTGPPGGGTITPLNQLAVPTLTLTANPGGITGFMPSGTTLYFWLTVQTRWGESLVGGNKNHTFSSGSNNCIRLNWAEPTDNYYLFSRIYWYTANTSSAATLLTEYQRGFTVDGVNDQFDIYAPYVAYNQVNTPLYSSAYTGFWAGGLWQQDV